MPSEKYADLHLHTFYSDGTFSPSEVVRRARTLRLSAVSITDHDSVEGLEEALQAAGDSIEILPGVELTAAFHGREVHLLGYGFQIKNPSFSSLLGQRRLAREDRIQKIMERLHDRGIDVSLEEVRRAAGQGALGRPHLAHVLVNKGVVRSVDEAFQRYLGDHAPCFIKTATLTVPEAVRQIHHAGGVTVLAHPFHIVEDSWIPECVEAGVEGLEVYHSEQQGAVAEKYRRIAVKHNLLITGGSDCHGLGRGKKPLIGTVCVPYALVEDLKTAIREKTDV